MVYVFRDISLRCRNDIAHKRVLLRAYQGARGTFQQTTNDAHCLLPVH